MLNQRGLSDARFPGDKDDLLLILQRPAERLCQMAEFPVSTNQFVIWRVGDLSRSRSRVVDLGNEAIATPGQCFDESRALGIIPERAPDIADVALEHLGLDVGFGPQGLQHLLLGHQPAGMLHQIPEHRKCFGSQQNATFFRSIATMPKALVSHVHSEWRELCHTCGSILFAMVALCGSLSPALILLLHESYLQENARTILPFLGCCKISAPSTPITTA